ncbi:MAG: ParB/Srx family N-terminal domain-containing protein [Kiritimatiellae bacterium]|nr:ParB/Srx family N-terminal domain-containing protein [Kiritimatiellia bacterium]
MEYVKLPVENIQLDVDNPRIRHWMELHGGEITAEDLALALSGGDSNGYRALHESIVANGGIITPILVNRTKDGTHVVVEGNTRVQIYKEMFGQTYDPKWETIISVVYEDLPKESIHAIRLQSHLVGARDWIPFSKAKYLYYLSEEKEMPLSQIISICGGTVKSTEIKKLIEAYKDYTSYYVPAAEAVDMDPDPQEFSKFVECQRQTVLDALLKGGFNKSNFAKWVVEEHVDTAMNVRLLPSVLANKDARRQFLKTNIKDASDLLVRANVVQTDLSSFSLYDLSQEVYKKLKALPYEEFKLLKYDPTYVRERDILHVLGEQLQDKLADIDDED